MAYPSSADFFSKVPKSAWWITKNGASYSRVDTTGYAFARLLQKNLKERVPGTVQSWDGPTTPSHDITVDGKFGPKTLRAIWAVLTPEVRDAIHADPANRGRTIQDDDRERSITRATMVSAIWAMYALSNPSVKLKSGELYLSEAPDLVSLPYSSMPQKPTATADQTSTTVAGFTAAPAEFSSAYGVASFGPVPTSAGSSTPTPATTPTPTATGGTGRAPAVPVRTQPTPEATPGTRTSEVTTTEGNQEAEAPGHIVKEPPQTSVVPYVVVGAVALIGIGTVIYLATRKKDPK